MNTRQEILEHYLTLIEEYHSFYDDFEKVQYSEDEEEFDNAWRKVFKAHEHKINFRDKHKITRSEVVEYITGGRE